MAESLARSLTNWDVKSAGVAADTGSPASGQAVEVMKRRGHDLAPHRSQPVNEDMIEWADLVLTMTRQHKEILLGRFPQATSKVYTLKEYAQDDASRNRLQERLHALFLKTDEKRREFSLRHSPDIEQLQRKRAELRQELAEVEQRLAELQSELREVLQQERAEIAQVESMLSGEDVADPFGQTPDVYEACAQEIEEMIRGIDNRQKGVT